MPRSPRLLVCLLALAMLGPATGVGATGRNAAPDPAIAAGAQASPTEAPTKLVEPRQDPTTSPHLTPRNRWRGYIGTIERSVQKAIERARPEAQARPADPAPAQRENASPATGAPEEVDGGLPTRLWFGRVVPNPSAGRASLRFDLPAPARVRVAIVDVAGRIVSDTEINKEAGRHTFALDLPGGRNAPGVYFVIMDVDGQRVGTRRLVLRY